MSLFKKKPTISSPRDIIPHKNIKYLPHTNTILIEDIEPDVWITGIQDTNSMLGLMDIGHTVLLTNSFDRDDLKVGDVIVYQSNQQVIHRIIKITVDDKGRLYTLKGDSNKTADPYLVRNEHINWLMFGVIY